MDPSDLKSTLKINACQVRSLDNHEVIKVINLG